MTAPVLLQPMPQFSDENGKPYVGGLIYTYVKGTFTPKTTWKDPGQAAVNTNPITLDGAGRCSMWGDGDFQLILQDAAGNQIWSQPATTIVSAAMYSVVSAPTTLDAMNYLGVTAAIAAEASARDAAINTASHDLQLNINAEAAARVDADTNITNYATAAVADLIATDTNLQAQISTLAGSPVVLSQGGVASLTFGIGTNFTTRDITFPPFASACHAVVVTPADNLFLAAGFSNIIFTITNVTNGGARINAQGLGGPAGATFNTTVYWIATGS